MLVVKMPKVQKHTYVSMALEPKYEDGQGCKELPAWRERAHLAPVAGVHFHNLYASVHNRTHHHK